LEENSTNASRESLDEIYLMIERREQDFGRMKTLAAEKVG